MHSKNIPLFFIVASLTSTSLGLHPQALAVKARRSLDILLARQAGSDACTTICNNLESSVNACTTLELSCLCTATIANEIQGCINCDVDPSASDLQTEESLVTKFNAVCAAVPGLPSLTINPGTPQTTNTPVTTVQPPVTTPAPVTQTVIEPTSTTPAPTTNTLSVGSTSTSTSSTSSTSSIGNLPLKSSASPNKIVLDWAQAVALVGLAAAGNILVF